MNTEQPPKEGEKFKIDHQFVSMDEKEEKNFKKNFQERIKDLDLDTLEELLKFLLDINNLIQLIGERGNDRMANIKREILRLIGPLDFLNENAEDASLTSLIKLNIIIKSIEEEIQKKKKI